MGTLKLREDQLPPEDIRVSSERNIHFRVAVKDTETQRWQTFVDDISSLSEAWKIVTKMDTTGERAIFLELTSGGLFYWSSRKPQAFNSQLIHDKHYIGMYE